MGARRRKGRTYVPNETIYGGGLTPPALGVLLVLLSRPRGAPSGYRQVMAPGFGEVSARKALAELDARDYRHLFRRQDPVTGRYETRVYVYPKPTPREEAEAEHASTLAVEAVHRAEESQARHRAEDSEAPVHRGTVKPGTTTYHPNVTTFRSGRGTNVRGHPRCPTHPHREVPCLDCAGDHKAGDHVDTPAAGCRLCTEEAERARAAS